MIKLSENELNILHKKMFFHGHKTYTSDFFATKEYKRLRYSTIDHLNTRWDNRLSFHFCSINDILKAGKYVVEKHANEINIRVPYTNNDYLTSMVIAKFGTNPKPKKYDKIIRFIKNHVEWIDATNIPVYLNTDNEPSGSCIFQSFYSFKDLDQTFLEKLPVYLSEIILLGPCQDNQKMTYIHELYHALLNRNKGSVYNKLHDEALSIFMEKVGAMDLDDTKHLLTLRTLYRLLDLKECIMKKTYLEYTQENGPSIIDFETYIISTLLATALFHTYKNGSNSTRKEIDSAINQVLLGNGIIEDVFQRFEATEEKGSVLVRKQLKKFHR